ncbi:hypothetical protein ACFV8T_35105 [Streptomyces sp. NPDC059832]|uniref:hypothetical protein n=1 Tax=unclassified Streptomyces TaxID=2593676 RepID=UPI003668DA4E
MPFSVRAGVERGTVQVWEDGFRTAAHNDDPDVFEWWYSDSTGDDGTVVSFTPHTRVNDGFLPAPSESDRKPAANVTVAEGPPTRAQALSHAGTATPGSTNPRGGSST